MMIMMYEYVWDDDDGARWHIMMYDVWCMMYVDYGYVWLCMLWMDDDDVWWYWWSMRIMIMNDDDYARWWW